MKAERRARMGLAAAQDAGDAAMVRLVRERGAVEVWRYAHSGSGNTAFARRAREVDPDDLARQTKAIGARFIIPGDEEWPSAVNDLAWGEQVGGFGGEPLGLWIAGPARLSDLTASVAIVGSRASTAYGEHITADLASCLAEKGYAVLSGGAYGIDASAHRGALATGGLTVAVMAGGLGGLYPPGNTTLLQRVRAQGALVSEYPPDRPPSRARFLVRNRLIAALSQATVIVEAAMRSGARNTVSWALSIHRPVLGVPGPITSATSVTPHRLIRDGAAILVTSAEEVMEVLGPPGHVEEEPISRRFANPDSLTSAQKAVRKALSLRIGRSVDELSARAAEPVWVVLASLAQLADLADAEETSPGMWRRVRPQFEEKEAGP